jgi:hypothetical protein
MNCSVPSKIPFPLHSEAFLPDEGVMAFVS